MQFFVFADGVFWQTRSSLLQESEDWKTASQTVFQAPAQRKGELRTYVDTSKARVGTFHVILQTKRRQPVSDTPRE
jgi:hypothetical protein